MHEFDIYCKKELGIKYYLRYADDVFIFAKGKENVISIMSKCILFTRDVLKLTIVPHKCYIAGVDENISGLGYIFTKKGLKLRDKSIKSLKQFAYYEDFKRLNRLSTNIEDR